MEESKTNLSVLRKQRIDKIAKLKILGINPYPSKPQKEHNIGDILTDYSKFEDKYVYITGRLMSWREHGQLIFGHVTDESGRIQLYIKSDTIHKTSEVNQSLGWDDLNLVDIGDFIQAEGNVTKTKTGEISILVKRFRIISKSLRPLPDKWKGITDKEIRYRRRYLDLAMSSDVRDLFKRKSKFWLTVREFLKEKGFIEVETPVLELKTGGADARPFITYHNDLGLNLYMRISTELYQKRLIGGGFEKIFTLGPNFRNEGVDDEHVQEYTALEWYWAYADYKDNMKLTADLLQFIALKVYGKTKFTTRGLTFDLSDEWKEIDYYEIIRERFGIDIFKDDESKMLEVLKKEGVKLPGVINRNRLIDNLWKQIRKTIAGPAFLINEPKFMSPLAKSKPDNIELTERYHIIIAGSELGNGYSEINDPIDQLDRFLEQEKARLEGDDESQMLDIDFVEMLEYGMPPTSGFGMSERVFWYFEDVSAREGTLFPLMKSEVDHTTKDIYGDILETKTIKKKIKKDFSKKIALVLNKDLLGWQLNNTISQLSMCIGNKLSIKADDLEKFETSDSKELPPILNFPVVSLSAKPSQFHDLIAALNEEKLIFSVYTEDMIKFSDDEELKKIIKTKEFLNLKIFGVGIFGDNDKVNRLTKKFSLWK